jgi:hypothetical protein
MVLRNHAPVTRTVSTTGALVYGQAALSLPCRFPVAGLSFRCRTTAVRPALQAADEKADYRMLTGTRQSETRPELTPGVGRSERCGERGRKPGPVSFDARSPAIHISHPRVPQRWNQWTSRRPSVTSPWSP